MAINGTPQERRPNRILTRMERPGGGDSRLHEIKTRYSERLDRARLKTKQLSVERKAMLDQLKVLQQENARLRKLASLAGDPATQYYLAGSTKKIDIRADPRFGPLARRVIDEGRTSMNYDRLYILWQVARAMPAGYPAVEIGTFRGGSARFLIETFRALQRETTLYVCDTFRGHAQVDPEVDGRHQPNRQFLNTSAEDVRAYLSDYPGLRMLVGDFVETSNELRDTSAFGLVHLDVDVYPPTAFALDFFAGRLAPGAAIVVDDYGFVTCAGTKKAVDDFVAARPEFQVLHLLTGQAILTRRP